MVLGQVTLEATGEEESHLKHVHSGDWKFSIEVLTDVMMKMKWSPILLINKVLSDSHLANCNTQNALSTSERHVQ